MGQVTFYLDEQTEKLMRQAAKSAGLSQSKWVAHTILEKAGNQWPAEIVSLAGAWADIPTAEELRNPKIKDSVRETL